eukprot:177555-Chlamydomonas_euryale.AAC.3
MADVRALLIAQGVHPYGPARARGARGRHAQTGRGARQGDAAAGTQRARGIARALRRQSARRRRRHADRARGRGDAGCNQPAVDGGRLVRLPKPCGRGDRGSISSCLGSSGSDGGASSPRALIRPNAVQAVHALHDSLPRRGVAPLQPPVLPFPSQAEGGGGEGEGCRGSGLSLPTCVPTRTADRIRLADLA